MLTAKLSWENTGVGSGPPNEQLRRTKGVGVQELLEKKTTLAPRFCESSSRAIELFRQA